MSYTHSAIITGGTIGLGYWAALDIARHHPDWLVVICSRTDKESAADKINQTLQQTNTIFLPLDLSESSKTRAFATTWSTSSHPPIAALLLNAALQFPAANSINLTPDGLEPTFAITHVNHALLFHLLFPHLAPDAHIVVTASGVHDPAQKSGLPDAKYISAEAFAHPSGDVAKGPGTQHYSNAKLANVMWSYAAHRRLSNTGGKGSGMKINAFDPGLMPGTGLARAYPAPLRFLWYNVLPRVKPVIKLLVGSQNIHTAAESGAALARLALAEAGDKEVEGVSGRYFEGRKEIKSSVQSYDEGLQDELWEWTVGYCAGGDEGVRKRFEGFK